MSQKEKNSQSQPGAGGQKFGGRGGNSPPSRGRHHGRPAGRGFSEKDEGDRSGRPARSSARPYDHDARFNRNNREGDSRDRPRGKPFEKREFGSEGRRDFGSRDSRPPRDRSYNDKPYQKREFGNNEGRRDNFGDKKPFNREK